MNTGTRMHSMTPDPLAALLAEWLSRVICAAHEHPDIDSSDSYAHATDEAMQARLAAERIAEVQVARLYAGLARRAAERDAPRTTRSARAARAARAAPAADPR